MPITDSAAGILGRHSEAVCLAIQQEDVAATISALARLDASVRELILREDPESLRVATAEVMRRARRLALANRQMALIAMSTLRGGDAYQDGSRSSTTWTMNG